VIGAAAAPAQPQRKRRRLVVVPHRRRRVPRAAWRGFEVSAWMACVVVIMTVATILAAGLDFSVRWREPANAAAAPSPECLFVPCAARPITGEPTRLRITSLGVDAPLEVLQLDATRQLKPPISYDKPGWFGKGIVPGDEGAAVIAGHVDSTEGPGIFYELHTLGVGDVVDVLRGSQWVSFRVTGTERYPKDEFPSERVYGPTPGAELRLITCGGTFDRRTLSYRDNIVVYAIIERT
jgi:Sortase domain